MAADDEKTVIKELLDADDDGKLSFEDAKAIAAKMAASARKRLVTLLDEDGDGEISWDEVQGGARGALHRCEEALTRAWRVLEPHKTKLLAGAGVISCFHGTNFKYTILFAGSFQTTAWPRVKPALTALAASYKAGKREFAKNAPQLKAARDTLKRCSRELEACKDDDAARARIIKEAAHAALLLRKTSTSLFAAIDGPKLLEVCKEAYLGTFAAFAAVLSSTAAKVGVGMGLGTKVAAAVNSVVAPVVAKMLRTLRDRALSNKDIQQAVEDMSEAAGVDDDDVRGWVESVIGLCASALGIYVAHRLDDVVFLYGACGAGAALAVDKCAELGFSFKPRARHLIVGALAGAGFAYQTTGIGPGLPFFIRWPLLPFRASEACLASLAYGIRAADARAT